MPRTRLGSLRTVLASAGDCTDRFLWGIRSEVSLTALLTSRCLGDRPALTNRCVLIATHDQLETATALIELDGVARRMIVCPPGISDDHLQTIVEAADVDAVVSDSGMPTPGTAAVGLHVACGARLVACSDVPAARERDTEWILLTSGTSGKPKMVRHDLSTLSAAINSRTVGLNEIVWGTFYDIRRYGGLQIFLRAILGNGSLILSSVDEPPAEYLSRLAARAATHVSGTPSHWRSALWSRGISAISPRYIRLSGEIATQGVLDQLHAAFPKAALSHAFASTEGVVGFTVTDGLEGFPADVVGQRDNVTIKIENSSLRIRSPGNAFEYIGTAERTIRDADGFVDTGDIVELRGQRFYFLGRTNGVINVGGLKVHPEEVEGIINRHPLVKVSLVRPKKNPVLGSVVVADVTLKSGLGTDTDSEHIGRLKQDIIQFCSTSLPQHKVPVMINVVSELTPSSTGKVRRANA
jgi:acyl-CoA synthetase (AMP-forming)/AMP-acid ligase II